MGGDKGTTYLKKDIFFYGLIILLVCKTFAAPFKIGYHEKIMLTFSRTIKRMAKGKTMQKYYCWKYKNHLGNFTGIFRDRTILMLFLPGVNEEILSFRLQKAGIPEDIIVNRDTCQDQFTKEINDYFAGSVSMLKTPYELSGTPFQVKVWNAVSKIPYGNTVTYGDIACEIGNPNACRAVGSACGANPLPIIIPCHRVRGQNSPGGFTGGMFLKKQLLNLESRALSRASRKGRQNCHLT